MPVAMMKIKPLILAHILLMGQSAWATTPSNIQAYKIADEYDQTIQITINHTIGQTSGSTHYINEVLVSYQDSPFYKVTFKHQEQPYVVTVFAPCSLTLDDQEHMIQVGDHIVVLATCNHGGTTTENVKVQNAP